MTSRDRNRGVSTKGYYKRAKIFGYLMVAVAVAYIIYYLISVFTE